MSPGNIATGAAILLFLALTAINGNVSLPASVASLSDRIMGGAITVVDGDTIRIGGRLTRLVGFNTPETYEPRCEAEARLGQKATARLRALVAGGVTSFSAVNCACPPGTQGTDACNYGRACGTLRVDGRDVGSILVAEGLAARFVCRGDRCPPTPRPWCRT